MIMTTSTSRQQKEEEKEERQMSMNKSNKACVTAAATELNYDDCRSVYGLFEYSSDEGEECKREPEQYASSSSSFESFDPQHPRQVITETIFTRNPLTRSASSTTAISAALSSVTSGAATHRKTKSEPLPDSANAWNELGNTHFREGRYQDALQAYKEAVQCDSSTICLADTYNNLATVYWKLQQAQLAIDFWRRARRVHEYNCDCYGWSKQCLPIASVRYQLGFAYLSLKQYQKAQQQFEKCSNIYRALNDTTGLAKIKVAQGQVVLCFQREKQAMRWQQQTDNLVLMARKLERHGDVTSAMIVLERVIQVRQHESKMHPSATLERSIRENLSTLRTWDEQRKLSLLKSLDSIFDVHNII